MKKHLLYFILLVSSYHAHLYAVIKGSTSQVSIEPIFQFKAADLDNKIQGFAWFKDGFSLENNATTCDFASVYPVSGVVALHGGTLNLLEDLILKNSTTLESFGTIVGNHSLFELCSSITVLPPDTGVFEDVYVVLSNSVVVQGQINCVGATVIDGRGNTLDLQEKASLKIAPHSTLHLKNMIVKGVGLDNISGLDDSATLILDNVTWVQSADVIFESGALCIQNKVEFCGNYAFRHTSSKPVSIAAQSMWSLLASIDLKIGKHLNAGAVDPLQFQDNSSILKLSNCSLFVTEGGLRLTKGKLIFDEEVHIDMASTTTMNGIIIGDGVESDNDFTLRFNAGVSVTHKGHTAYNNVSPDKIIALSKNATIIRDENSNIFMARNATMPPMTFESLSNAVQPIQHAPGVEIVYQDDQIVFPAVAFDITGCQNMPNTFCLKGSDEIFFTKGSLPLNLQVSGKNNLMHGNGGIMGLLSLQDTAAELICSVLGPISTSPHLNGGSLILTGDFALGPDIVLSGSGTVNLNSFCFTCGSKDAVWQGQLLWQGTNGSLEIQSQVTLQGTWTIDGQVTIDGNGNTLDISAGDIVVNPHAKLLLKNIRLIGIKGSNIRCVDDTGKLSLLNVIWVQTDDVLFDKGSLQFVDEVDFIGSYTFVYDSSVTSTIAVKSTLQIGNGMQFSIGRTHKEGAAPLYFEDRTSTLSLENCALQVTGFGLPLARGRVLCSRDVTIDILSTDTTNGIELGTGAPDDDMIFEFYPGCVVRFVGGHVVYNVTRPDSVVSQSTTAKLVRGAKNVFYMKRNILLSNLTIDASILSVTHVPDDVSFDFENCEFVLPAGKVVVSGSRYNAYTNVLKNGDSLFITSGVMPMATVVLGKGTSIVGNGSLGGPVVFASPESELVLALDGLVSKDITLNGGVLTLGQDTHFASGAVITDSGTVNVSNYRMQLTSQEIVWQGDITWQSTNAIISLNADVALAGSWIVQGNCTLQGNGNVLDLRAGGSIEVAPGSALKLVNVRIIGVHDSNVRCADDTGSLILDQVVWVQTGNATFDHGRIQIIDEVDFLGSYTFSYQSTQSSFIHNDSTWHITDLMRFTLGKQSVPEAQNPLLFAGQTATLSLDNCTIAITDAGWDLLKGCIKYKRNVDIEVLSTSSAAGVFLGNGMRENDPLVFFDPGSNARFVKGHIIYNIVNPANLHSDSTSAQMQRLAQSHFVIKQDVYLKNFTVDASPYAITEVDVGKRFAYKNCIFSLPNGRAEVTASRYNEVSNILFADDLLLLRYGAFPMATLVAGQNAMIAGTGDVVAPLVFVNPTATLLCGFSGSLGANVMLNGARFIVMNDVHFAGDHQFIGDGTVVVGDNRLSFGPKDATWSGNLVWHADNGNIDIKSNISLNGTWTFSGSSCLLDCNGNTLELLENGKLIINDNCTLHIKNAQIKGIRGTNICAIEDSSKLILENVTWVQQDEYQFEHGSLIWQQDVVMEGGIFNYRSNQTSHVADHSCVCLDQDFIFNYEPENGDTNLIALNDESSMLELNGAIIRAPYGIAFTQGTFICKKNATLISSHEQGITFGTGNADNDCTVMIYSGVQLVVAEGALNYNNRARSSWQSGNSLSTVYFADTTTLNVYATLDLGGGEFMFGNHTLLNRAADADIKGSITLLGELSFGTI
ncbi:MAG: hypothetical protein AB7F19_05405 [Candidatus Babeliales bacterium]